MNIFKKLISLTAVLALCASQVQAQEYCDDCSPAYCDSEKASYLSAALPIGALVVAAIIIATTDRHHHHHSSSNTCGSGNGNSCSSSHFSHCSCECF